MRQLILTICMVPLLVTGACTSYPDTPITTEMTSEDYVHDFVQKKCGLPSGALSQLDDEQRHVCSEKWGLIFAQKLHEKYPYADLHSVSERCNASPLACDPGHMESWAQDSDSERQNLRMPATKNGRPELYSCKNLSTPCASTPAK